MTLNQWESKHPHAWIIDKGDGYIGVHDTSAIQEFRWELWHLDDWFVSAVQAGVIWLWPKKTGNIT